MEQTVQVPKEVQGLGAVASGDHGTDDKPTDLVFQTTADGAGSSRTHAY